MQSNQVILPELLDKEAVYTALRELDLLGESVYKSGNEGFDKVLESSIDRDLYRAVIESIKLAGGGNDAQTRNQVVETMKQALEGLPVIKIRISVKPTRQLIKRIHEWIKTNLGERTVLELETDEEILGGATIAYNGKYTDKSISGRWPEIWKQVSEGR